MSGPSSFRSLEVAGLSKRFGAQSVINEVYVSIASGQLVGILGSSGTGKTTLLRCIAGLESPDRGSVFVCDEHGAGRTIPPHAISMIFQDVNLVRQISALDNVVAACADQISFAEMIFRFYRPSIEGRAMHALSQVGLVGWEHKRADSLSGGQQQRVAIARAIMRKSSIILADEPVSSLDQRMANDVLMELRKCADGGATVICSLHQVELALKHCDRILAMKHGKIAIDKLAGDMSLHDLDPIYA